MAEIKTTLSFTKIAGRRRSGEEKERLEGGVGVEMASRGLAVTMVLLSFITVGKDLPQCLGRGETFLKWRGCFFFYIIM